MATMAPAVTSKSEHATALRNEAAALQGELSKLRADLENAKRILGAAEAKRQKLVDAAGRGELTKTAAVAAIEAEIDAAKIGVEAFAPRVGSKEARLAAVNAELENLSREMAIEAQRAARQARFDTLRTQGTEAAARINEKLRALLEEDFVALDAVRDALLNEFIGGRYSTAVGTEVAGARALVHELEVAFFDGAMGKHERALLRAGWTVRGDLRLPIIQNLTPPRK